MAVALRQVSCDLLGMDGADMELALAYERNHVLREASGELGRCPVGNDEDWRPGSGMADHVVGLEQRLVQDTDKVGYTRALMRDRENRGQRHERRLVVPRGEDNPVSRNTSLLRERIVVGEQAG